LTAVGMGILYFLGLAIGAWLALFIFTFSRVPWIGLPLFSGGFLAGLIGFTLLPHAFQHYNWQPILFGLVVSILIMALLHPITHRFSSNHSFTFIAIAIAFHTIPLSLAIGAIEDPVASGALTIGIVLHHIPEAAALTLWVAGRKGSLEKLFLFFILLSGIAMASIQIGKELMIPASLNSILIGLSIGILLYILQGEIFRRNPNNLPRKQAIGYTIAGVVVYGAFLWLLSFLGIK
jgi:ZIP family zinc transporter